MGPTERDKTDGPLGLNDGWVRRPLGAQRIILKNKTASLSIQFVQVLTNFW